MMTLDRYQIDDALVFVSFPRVERETLVALLGELIFGEGLGVSRLHVC